MKFVAAKTLDGVDQALFPDKLVAEIYHCCLYNNQINAHALIGQSAVGYCYYKPTEKSCVF